MKVTGMDHINMMVVDLEKTISFYKNVFGFEIKEKGLQQDDLPYAIIGEKNAVYLALYETKNKLKDNINGERVAHIGFHVDSFKGITNKLNDLGVSISYPEVNWGKSKSIWIRDPNGFEIELSENFGGALE